MVEVEVLSFRVGDFKKGSFLKVLGVEYFGFGGYLEFRFFWVKMIVLLVFFEVFYFFDDVLGGYFYYYLKSYFFFWIISVDVIYGR